MTAQMETILKEVKEAGEDFEWYPTTKEIISALTKDIRVVLGTKYLSKNYYSMLDVGAGNGKVFEEIEKSDEKIEVTYGIPKLSSGYAIEKSMRLIQELIKKNITVLGTDFWEQTLIDKDADIVFCNPPYKEYDKWAEKLIMEANGCYLYLVIPGRWKENKSISHAIKRRGLKEKGVQVIGSFDFLDSEDRKARAKVDLVRISLNRSFNTVKDPWDAWFEENFLPKEEVDVNKKQKEASQKRTEKSKALIGKENYMQEMAAMYNAEMEKLISNYQKLASLDKEIFLEMEITVDALIEKIKAKIENLKKVYWMEFFTNFEKINSRLISTVRRRMIEKMTGRVNVDFTVENMRMVTIWALQNANGYFDEQIATVYKRISDVDAIRTYKSNEKMVSDSWRYNRRYRDKDLKNYYLDYRIVYAGNVDFGAGYGYVSGMNDRGIAEINDICIIAKNLGFAVLDRAENFEWKPGKKMIFKMKDLKSGKVVDFMSVKGFKNGNIHFQFNQEFMKAFNIEAARINKWVKSPEHAANEMNIDKKDLEKYWKQSFAYSALSSESKNLLAVFM